MLVMLTVFACRLLRLSRPSGGLRRLRRICIDDETEKASEVFAFLHKPFIMNLALDRIIDTMHLFATFHLILHQENNTLSTGVTLQGLLLYFLPYFLPLFFIF